MNLHDLPTAPWIQEMQAYYQKTGTYRVEDYYRLVGDQTKSVMVGLIHERT